MALHDNSIGSSFLEANYAEPTRPTQSDNSDRRFNISHRNMSDDKEEHVLEALLRERPGDLGSVIEVKWQGWTTEHNTWELRSQLLEDVPDMVTDFDSRPRPDSGELSESTHPIMKNQESTMSDRTSTTEDVSMASSNSMQGRKSNITSWKGWAELENDPLIFSTLLREWGVQGVGVREVIPLDAVFDTPVDSTLGLIFLSRYVVFDQDREVAAPSENLWFANQISSFSCATVALMNIIINRTDLDLGDGLRKFKDSTHNLSPKDRGLALDSLESVRDVHNSFATENDKFHVDSCLKDDVKNANTKKRAQNRWARRKGRKKAKTIDDDDESGLHFVAFVPAIGQLWRLDGLEREPTGIGRIAEGDNWLTMVVPVLEAQFNAAAMNELEFSLLSVVLTTPDAVDEKDYERMRRVREDWSLFMATMVRLHAEKGDIAAKLG